MGIRIFAAKIKSAVFNKRGKQSQERFRAGGGRYQAAAGRAEHQGGNGTPL